MVVSLEDLQRGLFLEAYFYIEVKKHDSQWEPIEHESDSCERPDRKQDS